MAVTAQNVVETRLRPVLDWSAELVTDIPFVIEQEIVAQGWSAPLTSPQELYVGLLATKSLIIRLIAHCLVEVQEEQSGEERARWEERQKLLRLLGEQIDDELAAAKKVADPDEPVEDRRAPPPHSGIEAI